MNKSISTFLKSYYSNWLIRKVSEVVYVANELLLAVYLLLLPLEIAYYWKLR
jgi:hypothetical protein